MLNRLSAFALLMTLSGVTNATQIGSESRHSFAQWAEKTGVPVERLHKQHMASGVVSCGTAGLGSGELVIDNQVLVTASHNFFQLDENGQCVLKKPDMECVFQTTDGLKTIETEILLETIVIGAPDACKPITSQSSFKDDWAVALLKDPVVGAKAYELASTDKIEVGQRLIHIAGAQEGFTDEYTGDLLKTISVCSNMISHGSESAQTSCDTSPYSSGSAQLRLEDMKLVGIHIGDLAGNPGGEFDAQNNSGLSIPIGAKLRQAIAEKVAKLKALN